MSQDKTNREEQKISTWLLNQVKLQTRLIINLFHLKYNPI